MSILLSQLDDRLVCMEEILKEILASFRLSSCAFSVRARIEQDRSSGHPLFWLWNLIWHSLLNSFGLPSDVDQSQLTTWIGQGHPEGKITASQSKVLILIDHLHHTQSKSLVIKRESLPTRAGKRGKGSADQCFNHSKSDFVESEGDLNQSSQWNLRFRFGRPSTSFFLTIDRRLRMIGFCPKSTS